MPRAILILILSSAGWASAQHRIIGRVYDPLKTKSEVRVTALFSELPTSGYLPVRIYLKNATKIPRTWSFKFTSSDSDFRETGSEMRSSFSAFCGAGDVTSREFLVPLVTAFRHDFDLSTELVVNVNAAALPPLSGSMQSVFHPNWPSVAISAVLHTANGSMLQAAVQAHLSGGTHAPGPHFGITHNADFGGSFEPSLLSEDWRAYTGLDVLMMTEKDWKDANPGARTAILRWNRLGGSFIIYSPSGQGDLATIGIDPALAGSRHSPRSWGQVEILRIGAANTLEAADTVDLVATKFPRTTGKSTLDTLRSDFAGRWPLQIAFGSKTAHVVFFVLILIAFGVLVGPVNLFVFAKAGQRHRLFITTPLISIGASLLLVFLILFQDGFGGRGQRMLLIEVRPDNEENSAYIAQEQIARTGVLLASNFTTSEPAYFTPVLLAESRWARVTAKNEGGKGRYTTDVLEQGLKVAGDWFQSRSEHGHLLQTIRPTRGRIELVSSNPPVVTSTFEFPLETLYFTTPDGSRWSAENVQQGRRTPLTAAGEPEFKSWLARQKARFSTRNQKRLDLSAPRFNHFLASSSEAPAVETLRSINWIETGAVISGPVITP